MTAPIYYAGNCPDVERHYKPTPADAKSYRPLRLHTCPTCRHRCLLRPAPGCTCFTCWEYRAKGLCPGCGRKIAEGHYARCSLVPA